MSDQKMSLKKLADFVGSDYQLLLVKLDELIEHKIIPPYQKIKQGVSWQNVYSKDELPLVLSKVGFLKKTKRPMAVTVFTTKGGVLKTTLGLNLARVAALHGLSVCVVGLDMQGDMTNALGAGINCDDQAQEEMLAKGMNINQLANKIDSNKGLYDYYKGDVKIDDIIQSTDLENLFLIPETPELVALNDHLGNLNRREYWLSEKIIRPLKTHFDLIIMDCSPNWNRLTTNALVGSDVLLSPLECKINNFRNYKVFSQFLREFQRDMNLALKTIFVPTRFVTNRRLGLEIKKWYEENVSGITKFGVPECVLGEEASALNISVLEHAPNKLQAQEMRLLLTEIGSFLTDGLSLEISSTDQAQWS